MKFSSSLMALAALGQLGLAKSLIQATYWRAFKFTDPATSVAWNVTDIAYYFVMNTAKDGIVMPVNQTESDMKAFVRAAHAHDTKAVLSIGGWDASVYWSDLVKSRAHQHSFAQTLYDFMTQYDFDGIDIDWEYPNGQGIGCNKIRSHDTANLLGLLKDLRKLMGYKKIITAAVAADAPFFGNDGNPMKDVSEFAVYLDYINLMVYDEAGNWIKDSASASPLGQPDSTCGSDAGGYSAIAQWTDAKFPADQILLGIPTYATGMTTLNSTLKWTTVDKYNTLINQPISDVIPQGSLNDTDAGVDVCGNPRTFLGTYDYTQLISEGLLSSDGKKGAGGYTKYWDECSQTPFLFNSEKKHFVSYEDQESATRKAIFARKQGLAGVFTFHANGWPNEIYDEVDYYINHDAPSDIV